MTELTRREAEKMRRRLRARQAHERRRVGTLRTGFDARTLRLAGELEDLEQIKAQLEDDL